MKRTLKTLLIVFAGTLLVGCFDVDVYLKIKKPDKVDHKFTLILNKNLEAFLGTQLDSLKKDFKNFKKVEKGDKVHYVFWSNNVKPDKVKNFKITRIDGDKYEVIYEVKSGPQTENQISSALLAGYHFTLKMEINGKIYEHNADKKKGNLLIWKRPLSSITAQGLKAKVIYKPSKGIGTLIILITFIGLVIVAAVLYLTLFKKQKESTETEETEETP